MNWNTSNWLSGVIYAETQKCVFYLWIQWDVWKSDKALSSNFRKQSGQRSFVAEQRHHHYKLWSCAPVSNEVTGLALEDTGAICFCVFARYSLPLAMPLKEGILIIYALPPVTWQSQTQPNLVRKGKANPFSSPEPSENKRPNSNSVESTQSTFMERRL